jgi:hypothetical protein
MIAEAAAQLLAAFLLELPGSLLQPNLKGTTGALAC